MLGCSMVQQHIALYRMLPCRRPPYIVLPTAASELAIIHPPPWPLQAAAAAAAAAAASAHFPTPADIWPLIAGANCIAHRCITAAPPCPPLISVLSMTIPMLYPDALDVGCQLPAQWKLHRRRAAPSRHIAHHYPTSSMGALVNPLPSSSGKHMLRNAATRQHAAAAIAAAGRFCQCRPPTPPYKPFLPPASRPAHSPAVIPKPKR